MPMKTREDINREYEEAIRPHKDKYNRGIQMAQSALDADLTKIHDKYKDKLEELRRKLAQAVLEENSDVIYVLEERLKEAEDEKRRVQMEADHRYRKMVAPVKAEYDRATSEARNNRISAISKLASRGVSA